MLFLGSHLVSAVGDSSDLVVDILLPVVGLTGTKQNDEFIVTEFDVEPHIIILVFKVL